VSVRSFDIPNHGSSELIAEASIVRQFAAFLASIGAGESVPGLEDLQDALRRPDSPIAISARLIVELIETAARGVRRPDMAVRFVEWVSPRSLGALSVLGEHCGSYAARHRLASRYMRLENNAVLWDEQLHGDEVILAVSLNPKIGPEYSQFVEMLIALEVRRIRSMLGPHWVPLWVQLAHPAPASSVAQQRFFGCRVEYGAEINAVAIEFTDFHRPNTKANPELQALLEDHLAREDRSWPADFRGQVENLVAAQLANGNVSLARVAALLALSPRTLQRRLRENNSDFSRTLSFVRKKIVMSFLARQPVPSLTLLSRMLGYSESSSASRFVKLEFGASARMIHKTDRYVD